MSNTFGLTGSLSLLFTHGFLTLETLILKSCRLNSDDLQSLIQTKIQGKLPVLENLDISDNGNDAICDLFVRSFNTLETRGHSVP